MSRLVRAARCAARSAWCEIRGHDWHTLYAGGHHRLPTVRMRQCLRCGHFGGYSSTGWADLP